MTLAVKHFGWPPSDGVGATSDVVVAHRDPADDGADPRVETATTTLTEIKVVDPRWVQVSCVPEALDEIESRLRRWPLAAAMCDDVLRSVDHPHRPVAAIMTESFAYSTLQLGQEFRR